MERHEVQAFVRKHRNTSVGLFERKLWDVAERAPLGGIYIGSEANPYLLRIYVSPRSPQFKWLWEKLKAYAEDIGDYDPDLFQGVPHLYLHHFFRGDNDREVHNHPWAFSMSLILTSGYVEERWDRASRTLQTKHFYPGDINVIRRDDFHKVTLKDPSRGCWTLFLSSRRVEEKSGFDWGFLDTNTDQFTPWGPYVEARGGQAPKPGAV